VEFLYDITVPVGDSFLQIATRFCDENQPDSFQSQSCVTQVTSYLQRAFEKQKHAAQEEREIKVATEFCLQHAVPAAAVAAASVLPLTTPPVTPFKEKCVNEVVAFLRNKREKSRY
jgi:hypothetical protein